jgi:molybdate transport system substrate-binding protein
MRMKKLVEPRLRHHRPCHQIVLALTYLVAAAAHADTVPIAVASNFAEPARRIAAAFEAQSGYQVLLSTGATGKFYVQITNGAPFQVLLAADDTTPARLQAVGAAVADSRYTYAIGKLVLWSAQAGVVDADAAVLRSGGFAHLAIANPAVAPYGSAAVEAMQKLGVYAAIVPKLVRGDNIAQTQQFVLTGAATLGFVAMSQVYANGRLQSGSAWIVPQTLYRPIRQEAVLLTPGRNQPAALAFLRFLRGEAARSIIAAYGYGN